MSNGAKDLSLKTRKTPSNLPVPSPVWDARSRDDALPWLPIITNRLVLALGRLSNSKEAIELLKGEGPEDLEDLVMKLGMEIVRLAGVAGSTLSAETNCA